MLNYNDATTIIEICGIPITRQLNGKCYSIWVITGGIEKFKENITNRGHNAENFLINGEYSVKNTAIVSEIWIECSADCMAGIDNYKRILSISQFAPKEFQSQMNLYTRDGFNGKKNFSNQHA